MEQGRPLYFCPVASSSIYLFFLAYSQQSRTGCKRYFYTWCGPTATLGRRSEMCCTRLDGNAGCKKSPKNSPSAHRRTTLLGHIFATKAHNMVNFGSLTAEICWRLWGTPANFNGFRVLAALLHGTLVVGVSQTLRHRTEGATYIRKGGHHVGHWPTF